MLTEDISGVHAQRESLDTNMAPTLSKLIITYKIAGD